MNHVNKTRENHDHEDKDHDPKQGYAREEKQDPKP